MMLVVQSKTNVRSVSMSWVLVVFAAIAGVLNTIQAGANTTLKKTLEIPIWAVVIVFAVGLATSLAAALVTGTRPPTAAAWSQLPWWAWIGGVFGSLYIFSMMVAADRMGAAVFTALTVTMAVLTSLVMDHFGLLGFDVHEAGWGRIAGGALMIAGLALIARF